MVILTIFTFFSLFQYNAEKVKKPLKMTNFDDLLKFYRILKKPQKRAFFGPKTGFLTKKRKRLEELPEN